MADKKKDKPKGSGWLNVAVDYGPLLVFFLTYRYFAPAEGASPIAEIGAVIKGTGAFMVAAVIALAVSKMRLGKVSPMLWFSTALIVGFGALTIFFGDPIFVQIKPTIIYLVFGIALLAGFWRGRALLKILLEAAFEGLSDEGWLKLSRNWGVFFLFLAALNEALRLYLDFGDWLAAKLWVFLPLSFLFTFSQIPMLLKHGLDPERADEPIKDHPPTAD
jgi:intracellular septation protein